MVWKTRKWNDELIEKEIFKCMVDLQIDRMPTSSELRNMGRNDLHMAVQRFGKYSGWADKLSLSRKDSETVMGQNFEDVVTKLIQSIGHTVDRMSTKFPYDLLINKSVKVDVKCGSAYELKGSRVHSFGINKQDPTCDVYIILALSEEGQVERTMVIPSHLLRVKTLCIGKDSKYNRFIDRWDYIDKYSDFLKSVV